MRRNETIFEGTKNLKWCQISKIMRTALKVPFILNSKKYFCTKLHLFNEALLQSKKQEKLYCNY